MNVPDGKRSQPSGEGEYRPTVTFVRVIDETGVWVEVEDDRHWSFPMWFIEHGVEKSSGRGRFLFPELLGHELVPGVQFTLQNGPRTVGTATITAVAAPPH